MVESIRKFLRLGQRKQYIDPAKAIEGHCSFTYNPIPGPGSFHCEYPHGPCLLQQLKAEGKDIYRHHGQQVDGDCAIEAAQEGYTSPEQRGDPR